MLAKYDSNLKVCEMKVRENLDRERVWSENENNMWDEKCRNRKGCQISLEKEIIDLNVTNKIVIIVENFR